MNDKKQLAAMGAQYRLTEEQAKLLAERMPQSGVLQILDVEPLCMAKRIEELEAQVRVMAELLREAQRYVRYRLEYTECDARIVIGLICDIDAALAGNLPEQHPDDAAVDRFAAAMKAKLAAAREKGRGGWDDPEACSVEFLADLLVGHIGKGNTGNFEDIANLAMMLHQRGADPAVLAGHAPAPDAPEGWQMVPVEPTENMIGHGCGASVMVVSEAIKAWAAMLAAAPRLEPKP